MQSLEQLKSWAGSKGVAVDKVAIASSLEDGRAILVAGKDLSAGEAVLSVNDGNWLSPEAVKKSKLGKAVEGLEPWLQVGRGNLDWQHASSHRSPHYGGARQRCTHGCAQTAVVTDTIPVEAFM